MAAYLHDLLSCNKGAQSGSCWRRVRRNVRAFPSVRMKELGFDQKVLT